MCHGAREAKHLDTTACCHNFLPGNGSVLACGQAAPWLAPGGSWRRSARPGSTRPGPARCGWPRCPAAFPAPAGPAWEAVCALLREKTCEFVSFGLGDVRRRRFCLSRHIPLHAHTHAHAHTPRFISARNKNNEMHSEKPEREERGKPEAGINRGWGEGPPRGSLFSVTY